MLDPQHNQIEGLESQGPNASKNFFEIFTYLHAHNVSPLFGKTLLGLSQDMFGLR
jgi:hypothetical protein